ncbi:transposase family protein [Acinetobacter sp. c3-l95]|uniref:helix-turn-helix domain-containing protein n=1 Tax=Acinetobacter sp. c3-l95 TaxID=3342804 RepID=UPI0035B82C06
MRYGTIKSFSDSQFKRLTGINKPLFAKMAEVIKDAEQRKKKSGRPHTLCLEGQILLTLKYLRSYITYFELGVEYGLSESNAYRTVIKIENALVESKEFDLPTKPLEKPDDVKVDYVLIDVMECEIERPKKNKKITILPQFDIRHSLTYRNTSQF